MQNEGCPFIVIYDRMFSFDLPVKTLLVYALIHGYCREGNDGWFCYKKLIAERLRMQPSGVSRALERLFADGLITEYRMNGSFTLWTEFDDSGPFIRVYDWMLSLDLTGIQLLVFALIHGFSQDGKQCYGRREWIEKKLHITNVGKVISALKAKGFVREVYNPDKSSVLVASWGGSKIDPPGEHFETKIAGITFPNLPF